MFISSISINLIQNLQINPGEIMPNWSRVWKKKKKNSKLLKCPWSLSSNKHKKIQEK